MPTTDLQSETFDHLLNVLLLVIFQCLLLGIFLCLQHGLLSPQTLLLLRCLLLIFLPTHFLISV